MYKLKDGFWVLESNYYMTTNISTVNSVKIICLIIYNYNSVDSGHQWRTPRNY